jgi:cation diffusion facilitator CzcD-associated flavoprotein CzcO
MAETAAHVTMLQRSPTYITSLPAKDPIAHLLQRLLPTRLSGPAIRWFKAITTQGSYALSRRRPKLMKRLLRFATKVQLPRGYDIDTHFTPSYNPWDQRLCVVPNGDLFKAIKAGRASVVTDQIDTFTEKGVRVQSGTELEADIVVTATGLELLFIGGIKASVDGEAVDLPSKLTYKGMMLEGVPNFALAVGYTNASWTLKCDLTCDYVTRLLNHMHDADLRQCTPINRDAAITAQPLLGLSSGYIQRSADRFPKQGSKAPWQVHQSYLRDYRALKRSGIEDDAMVFSNPVREKVAVA